MRTTATAAAASFAILCASGGFFLLFSCIDRTRSLARSFVFDAFFTSVSGGVFESTNERRRRRRWAKDQAERPARKARGLPENRHANEIEEGKTLSEMSARS